METAALYRIGLWLTHLRMRKPWAKPHPHSQAPNLPLADKNKSQQDVDMAASDSEPAAKKPKLDSYIPTEEDGSNSTSVIFSLKDEKGALAKALRAFEVNM